MVSTLLHQILVLVAASVLLGVPGFALASLLRVRGALPDVLLPPVAAILGALVACAATAVQLLTHQPVWVPVTLHGVASLLLAAAAVLVTRRRRRANALTVPTAVGWSRWTSALVVFAALFAWGVRGAIRLDGLYHVSLSRKLVELAAPNFDNVNRFIDGGPNPTYALPGWHALVGWTGWLTGTDPIVAWEVMPVLVVALGVLAAAGLTRLVLDTPRAEPIGALTWVLARILMARREVDGDAILYGAVPGQVTFELVFPVLLAAIAVAMWSEDRRVTRTCYAVAFAAVSSVVIYHANYVPYVAILGLGYAAWWLVSGPFLPGAGRRLVRVGAVIAGITAVCFGAVLPLLAGIDDFGQPDETRIDYHLTVTHGLTHIRGGHAYEMLGMPGLLAVLVTPLVAWRWRSRAMPIAAGGLLALLTTCFIPPLYAALRSTGSLTIGLRINHVIGTLLCVMLAGAVLLIADWCAARDWGRARLTLLAAVAVSVAAVAGAVLGYAHFAPNWPGYLAWIGLGLLFLARAVQRIVSRARRTARSGDACAAPRPGRVPIASGRLVFATCAVLALALALPVGAISARRAVLKADGFSAGRAQGDLDCLGGTVERTLAQLPAGSIIMSDPSTSFRVMALAPVYVVGDYKVWNGTNQAQISKRLAAVNGFFDASRADEDRIELLRQQDVDYLVLDTGDARWLDDPRAQGSLETLDAAWHSLDSFADIQSYDGERIDRLIVRHPETFRRIALDDRADEAALPAADPAESVPCQSYGVWKITR